jgi:hypothetical protein
MHKKEQVAKPEFGFDSQWIMDYLRTSDLR